MNIATGASSLLESGDQLTRGEFHRRYCLHPEITKAELVEGVVYVPSPTRIIHAEPHAAMQAWLGVYRAGHPEVRTAGDATVFLDDLNEVKPDVMLWREEPGGPRVNEKGYLVGAPQLVVEIAASSASYDLHSKLEAYRRNGVHEYIVWRVFDGMIDWLRLRDAQYEWTEPDEYGVVESDQFPGLRLHIPKMLSDDLAGVLQELQPA